MPLGELIVEQHGPLGETLVCGPPNRLLRHQPAFLPGCERRVPSTRLGCRILEIGRVLSEQGVHSGDSHSKYLRDGRQCHQGSGPLASPSWPVPKAVAQPDLLDVQVLGGSLLYHMCQLWSRLNII